MELVLFEILLKMCIRNAKDPESTCDILDDLYDCINNNDN